MKNLIFAALTALALNACSTVETASPLSDLNANNASSEKQLTDPALGVSKNSVEDGRQK